MCGNQLGSSSNQVKVIQQNAFSTFLRTNPQLQIHQQLNFSHAQGCRLRVCERNATRTAHGPDVGAVFIPDVKVTQFIDKSAKHSLFEEGLLSSSSKLNVVFTPEERTTQIFARLISSDAKTLVRICRHMLDSCTRAAPGQWQAAEHGRGNALALQQLFTLGGHSELPELASTVDFSYLFSK